MTKPPKFARDGLAALQRAAKGIAPMKIYAWIGEDEKGSGVVGFKQAMCPAGMVPLVVIESDLHKIDNDQVKLALQHQARLYGKTIRLVEFTLSADNLVVLHGNH